MCLIFFNIFIETKLTLFLTLLFRNNNGDSPRHLAAISETKKRDRILFVLHAVGAERCEIGKYGCNAGCSADGDHNGAPPPVPAQDQVIELTGDHLLNCPGTGNRPIWRWITQ